MEPNFETHLFCLEHGIWFEREMPSICPECEREICEEHDRLMEEEE